MHKNDSKTLPPAMSRAANENKKQRVKVEQKEEAYDEI